MERSLVQKLMAVQVVKEFSRFGNIHYRFHKNPSLVPNLSQLNWNHTLFNIIRQKKFNEMYISVPTEQNCVILSNLSVLNLLWRRD